MDDMDLKARQEEDLERKLWKNKLNRRYRRNGFLSICGMSGFLIADVFIFIVDFNNLTMGKIFVSIAVSIVAMIVLSYIFGRCPHCDTWIDSHFFVGHCPFCGETLEVSKSLNQIEKKRQAESEKQSI